MATRFAQLFSRVGAPSLVRQFGETILYHPGGSGSRSITAIVERNVEVISETGEIARATRVRVQNNSTVGISATELNIATDEVTLPLITGGAAVRREITNRESDHNGEVIFMVR